MRNMCLLLHGMFILSLIIMVRGKMKVILSNIDESNKATCFNTCNSSCAEALVSQTSNILCNSINDF